MSSSLVCVQDYEEQATKILPRNALDYYRSGATQEITLQENKDAIKRFVIFICFHVLCIWRHLVIIQYLQLLEAYHTSQ